MPPCRNPLTQPDPETPKWESREAALCWLFTRFQRASVRVTHAQGLLGAPDCKAGPRFPGLIGTCVYCIQSCPRTGRSALEGGGGWLSLSCSLS